MKAFSSLICVALLLFGASDRPPVSGSPDPDVTRTGTTFLDASAERVIAVLGPPTRIAPRDGSFARWIWVEDDGKAQTLTLYQNRVLHVEPAFEQSSAQAESDLTPAEGIYLGQSTAELLERRGNPDEARAVSIHAQPGNTGPIVGIQNVVVYGDEWVTLAEGRVVRIGKAIPERAIHGPR